MKLAIFSYVFENSSNMKRNKNPSISSRVVPFGRTDGQTDMTKLIVTYHNFANAPKNRQWINKCLGILLLRSVTVWKALKDSRDMNMDCRFGLWSRVRHSAFVCSQLCPYNNMAIKWITDLMLIVSALFKCCFVWLLLQCELDVLLFWQFRSVACCVGWANIMLCRLC